MKFEKDRLGEFKHVQSPIVAVKAKRNSSFIRSYEISGESVNEDDVSG